MFEGIVELKRSGCRTNSPTSARHGVGLGYIRIWATSPRRLVFWDVAPSLYMFDLEKLPLDLPQIS